MLRRWYQQMFGLEQGEEWTRQWSEFDTGPVTFCVNGPAESGSDEWDWSGTPAIAFAG